MTIGLRTNFPVAYDSPDHVVPWGTRHDNSVNKAFTRRLLKIFNPHKVLRVLDLGCSGGGFVQSIVEAGHIGVGLEGSDWSQSLGRGAWGKTKTLFTCDITKPFELLEDGKRMRFDVVTAWEVFEHIKESDLPQLIQNIQDHIAYYGLLFFAISNGPDVVNGVNLHQTMRPRDWWLQKLPWQNDEDLKYYFGGHFVRGHSSDTDFIIAMRNSGPNLSLPRIGPKEALEDWVRETRLGKRL